MSASTFDPRRLDIARFAQEAGAVEGAAPLTDFSRLADEAVAQAIAPDALVVIDWRAQGETRRDAGLGDGVARPALHLVARTRLPLVCQRCLQPVWTELAVDRHFLFAPDEAQAVRLDERAQDDVLAASVDFDLPGLIEDELLLALPLAPRHDQCPQMPPLLVRDAAQDGGPDAAQASRPHPFAALAALKEGKPGPDNL